MAESLILVAALQGNTSAVFDTVQNLTSLQFLDLSGDTGIKGSIDSGTAHDKLCSAVQVRFGNLDYHLHIWSLFLSSQLHDLISYTPGRNHFPALNCLSSLQRRAAVQGNLVSLNLNSMGLSGGIPSCLYSQGSSAIALDLGTPSANPQRCLHCET